MNHSELLNQIWTEAAWRRPDSIVIDTKEWFQITTPSSQNSQMNGIYRSHITTEVDQKIQGIIDHYKKTGSSFRWLKTNETYPDDLGTSLEKHGLKKAFTAFGLISDAHSLMNMNADDVVVRPTKSEEAHDWVRTSALGWDNYPLDEKELLKDVSRVMNDPSTSYIYYSAFYKGQMVGTATLRMGQSAHLFGGAVLPEFRGKGIYRAMIAERARFALTKNVSLMTTHGISTTSAPILLNLGFTKINEIDQYVYNF